jgi:hypothetical protein
MTAREWYDARAQAWIRRSEDAERRALAISRARLVAFFAAVTLTWWGIERSHPFATIAGVGAAIAFMVLVARHARVLDLQERANSGRLLARVGVARLDRDWAVLPSVAAPRELDPEAHPYARDLDVFGHASLAQWLGAPATPEGRGTLSSWLLRPSAVQIIERRQAAITELGADPEWREAFAIEGRLRPEDHGALERFVAWAAGSSSAVPPILAEIAAALTILIWLLLGMQLAGLVGDPWWLAPLAVGVVLSFVYATRMYAAFDRASAGDRVLERYAAMFELVCRAERQSELLRQIRGRVGGRCEAHRAISHLAQWIGWSELRRSAALLHFPIQALTLWDFHVLFGIQRWRRRFGASVAGWLDALGEADAISVLAAIPHDEPAWCMPRFDWGTPSYVARALGHPLLPASRVVTNDVEVGPPGTVLLVTGSNMSGKSTLLRAIGLNAVLAQAGAPVCANTLTLPPIELQTSIRVEDSLERGISYFMAALAALKRIVDAAESRAPDAPLMLYLLDEVLQGTNSVERAVAVRGVTRHLLQAGAIGAMTTHDLSIAAEEPMVSSARLVHFTEQVHEDGTMTFDYRLRSGLAASRNAIRLMQLIGIQP